MAARLQPLPDGTGLPGIGIRAGDVGDQQLAHRQPFLDIGKVVGDRGGNIALGQQPQQLQAGVVVVVPAHRAGRKAADDNMRPAGIRRYHRITSLDLCAGYAR